MQKQSSFCLNIEKSKTETWPENSDFFPLTQIREKLWSRIIDTSFLSNNKES